MPHFIVEIDGQQLALDPDRTYLIGRDPAADLRSEDARVSWRHATLAHRDGAWLLTDQDSTNGTFAQGVRAKLVPLRPGAEIRLGSVASGPLLTVRAPAAEPVPTTPVLPPVPWHAAITGRSTPSPFPAAAFPGSPFPAAAFPAQRDRSAPTVIRSLGPTTRTIRIGRALDNDVVLADLQVSRHHAELRQLPDGRWEIVDLGSHNGIFLNGQPVQRALVGEQDRLAVGRSGFALVGGQLQEYVDDGAVTFSARHLSVEVPYQGGRRTLLRDVGFTVPEKSLVAVVGPSGSGKSTLLRALTGYRPADQGQVLYDGRDLYRRFAELRARIGLVPQSEILHRELTVRRALRYAAELRFPGDTEAAERERRIDEVLAELRLDQRADSRISTLSGGQQKRVSVALELLTKPSLIFLDEPTSGLDPGMDREVMQTLRKLADDGRTVLVVTHSVAELALCDRLLVLAPGGTVAYFGPPDEALYFFGYQSWADVFQAFENHPDHDWAGRYRSSPHHQEYSADSAATPLPVLAADRPRAEPPKPQRWRSQLSTLVRRYLAVLGADRGFLALSLILPLVLGGVSALIPDDCGLVACTGPQPNGGARMVLLVLAVGACLAGAANSVRELIKERPIYERERATGLSRSAYLMSKVVVLGAVSLVQGGLISAVGFGLRELPERGLLLTGAPAVELAVGITLLGFVAMMVGLVISALVRTAEKTMPLLVMFTIVQLVFTGAVFQLYDAPGLEQFAWLMPARWGVAAPGTTLDLAAISPVAPGADPLWAHSVGTLLLDWLALLVFAGLLGLLLNRLQRRHEPEVMQRG
ncbi:FHA domain-containing protein [Kitasatospora sp. NPDC002040]|uniref:FHA domain-containing protein n=1 Tax=Kitasatospora sp. NPDC002040 TaxID=3154661 RepID=UPI00332AE871